MGWLVVILVIGLLLLGWAFWDAARTKKAKAKAKEINGFEAIQEAAFAVIEASILSEPEDWHPIVYDDKAYWLVNRKTRIGVWVANGPEKLYVLQDADIKKGASSLYIWTEPSAREKLHPNSRMRAALYTAAISICMQQIEIQKLKKLERMISPFRGGKNDTETA